MKIFNRALALLLSCVIALSCLASCFDSTGGEVTLPDYVKITNAHEVTLSIGETHQIEITDAAQRLETTSFFAANDCVSVSESGLVTAVSPGVSAVTAKCGTASDKIVVTVRDEREISISLAKYYLKPGEATKIRATITPDIGEAELYYNVTGDTDCVCLDSDGYITALRSGGTVTVVCGIVGTDIVSDPITVHTGSAGATAPTSIKLSIAKGELAIGETARLDAQLLPTGSFGEISYRIIDGEGVVSVEGGYVKALSAGEATIVAECGEKVSNAITVNVFPLEVKLEIFIGKSSLTVGDETNLTYRMTPESGESIVYFIVDGEDAVSISGNVLCARGVGEATIMGRVGNVYSEPIYVTVADISADPYVGVSKTEFYKNYTPAKSYMDAYYRSKHYLMSGSIEVPDQAPEISAYQPKSGGKLVRNMTELYADSGDTYIVVDAEGREVMRIFRGGAYITIEEVAAYVYAFGEPPANQISKKSGNPSTHSWGEFLRLNHSYFSGDVDSYPYEPVLPNISGCGGSLRYYEMDIGTTGTDCDPKYTAEIYNDGYSITRGAARIVYGKEDLNGNGKFDEGEHYLFYTYNHYNDFREYLNYFGGWGEMFGNITGGGTISSRTDYNPTDYVPVYRGTIERSSAPASIAVIFFDKRYLFETASIA